MPALPAGVELFRFGAGGEVEMVTAGGAHRLEKDDRLLRFIDDGQRAHYLIGDADSGPQRPSHANRQARHRGAAQRVSARTCTAPSTSC